MFVNERIQEAETHEKMKLLEKEAKEDVDKKFVQQLYKDIQKLYKTLNLYIFCIQRLYKSIFCMIINECTKNVHQILAYIQKLYKLYKTCTKIRLKTA